MILEDLYADMRTRGLTKSRAAFAKQWLGTADNYMTHRDDNNVSPEVALALVQRLQATPQADLVAKALGLLLAPVRKRRAE